ncbi:MAG: hypothetical protein A2X46_02200 [Lentisphaerae bacterium GWF2_57_35]|nr:MAG: hypothetical protein A2X46_02200 [Lentisphaerae bacterium GWF2_57_35]
MMNVFSFRRFVMTGLYFSYSVCFSSLPAAFGTETDALLQTVIPVFSFTNQSLEAIAQDLRKQGVLVGLEIDDSPSEPARLDRLPEARITVTFSAATNTIEAVLKGMAGYYPSYAMQVDAASSVINIMPRSNALCATKLSSYSVTNISIQNLFQNAPANLMTLNISLVGRGRSRPVYDEIFIDVSFPGGTLADFLNLVSQQVGGQTSWTLTQGIGRPSLQLHFITPVHLLNSYKPNDYWGLTPESQLTQAREKLAHARENSERIAALKKIASLTDNSAEVSACYDQAIALADSDEEKWRLKATKLTVLYPPGRKSEEALLRYQEIIQNCPHEDIVLFAIFDAAHHYRVLGRNEEGAAMLKNAYDKYPSRGQSIRNAMKRQFPEYITELPTANESGKSRAYPEAFFNNPPSNKLNRTVEQDAIRSN